MTLHYLIIGGSVAAIAAAEAILSIEPAADITLLNEEPHPFYSRPGLAYYLAGEVRRDYLFPVKTSQRKALKIVNAHVARLHPDLHEVELSDGKRIGYDRLLLATGSTAVPINIPGSNLPGVLKLDTLDDASRLLAAGHGARSAVVIGGGITALEIAEGLHAHKLQVHYFLRGERYWNAVLDETESRIIEKRLIHDGIQLHYHTEAQEIVEKKGRIDAVITQAGEKIPCQMVAAAIGVRPRMELAIAAGLKTERGIAVNEFMQTSAADIYAAGDVAQVWDPSSGRAVLDTLWWVARQQGDTAGKNMAGVASAYVRRTAMNVTRLAGLTTTIIGQVGTGGREGELQIARGDSESWQTVPDAIAAQDGFDVNHIRLMVGQNTLLGALIMGDQTLSRPVYKLVSEQMDITPIRAALLAPDARPAEVLARFWAHLKGSHAAR